MICPLKPNNHTIIERLAAWITRRGLTPKNECSEDCMWFDPTDHHCEMVSISSSLDSLAFTARLTEKRLDTEGLHFPKGGKK